MRSLSTTVFYCVLNFLVVVVVVAVVVAAVVSAIAIKN